MLSGGSRWGGQRPSRWTKRRAVEAPMQGLIGLAAVNYAEDRKGLWEQCAPAKSAGAHWKIPGRESKLSRQVALGTCGTEVVGTDCVAWGCCGLTDLPASAMASAGFIASTMLVGIRMVAPRSLVVS